jgi:hypothetical protein
MNEGGDGFDEALESWRAVGVGLLRLLGGVEKVFERFRTILSSGDAFVGVLAVYDFSTTARGMEEGVGGVFLWSGELGGTRRDCNSRWFLRRGNGRNSHSGNLNGTIGASSSWLGEKTRGLEDTDWGVKGWQARKRHQNPLVE